MLDDYLPSRVNSGTWIAAWTLNHLQELPEDTEFVLPICSLAMPFAECGSGERATQFSNRHCWYGEVDQPARLWVLAYIAKLNVRDESLLQLCGRPELMLSAIPDDGNRSVPPISEFAEWRASDLLGAVFVLFGGALTGFALYLSSYPQRGIWLSGQILLAFAFVQWFAILHEAGHKTLFRRQSLNYAAGHLSGFLAGFPFDSWKLIHGLHHRWTGWQDLDATTAGLTPRERSR